MSNQLARASSKVRSTGLRMARAEQKQIEKQDAHLVRFAEMEIKMEQMKKAFEVFDGRQKRKLIYLTFIIFIDAFVELLGVSVIIPFIQAVTTPEVLLENKYARWAYDMLGMKDTSQFIILMAALIIFVYIFKNVFLVYMYNLQYKFSYYGKKQMQNTLMRYYIGQEYTFFLNLNSSELIRNINTDPEMFYTAVLNALQLASELCVSLVLMVTLVVTDPLITLGVIISLGIMMLILVKGLKKILEGYGNDRRTYSAGMLKCMQQAFGGIKEIKIANREEYFEQDFEKQNEIYTHVIKQNAFLSALPKPVIEALAIAGLMAMIIVKVAQGTTDNQHFIVVLGVFAVAAFKLLPSVNKISSYYAAIIHNGVVIGKICDEYREIAENKEKMEQTRARKERGREVSLKKEICVEHMEFTYPNVEEPVLKDVNVTIPKNSSVAFIGPSGAGKTTFVDLILGVLTPQKGVIMADDTDIQTGLQSWHDKIGYIPQTIYMLDDTIRNNIAFGAKENIRDEDIWEALRQAQLDGLVREMENGLDTIIGEAGVRISGGQRQRIGIARALYRKPEILVLDEATSALDNETEAAVMEAIDRLQGRMTLLIIAHRLSTIRNCDIVYKVENGAVVKDSVKCD